MIPISINIISYNVIIFHHVTSYNAKQTWLNQLTTIKNEWCHLNTLAQEFRISVILSLPAKKNLTKVIVLLRTFLSNLPTSASCCLYTKYSDQLALSKWALFTKWLWHCIVVSFRSSRDCSRIFPFILGE